jgi:hypothetical protein
MQVMNLDVNWSYQYEHISYLFRGWYPQWLMMMRSFTREQTLLLTGVALVYVWSAASINRSAR